MKRIPRPLTAAASILAGRVLWRLLRRNQRKTEELSNE